MLLSFQPLEQYLALSRCSENMIISFSVYYRSGIYKSFFVTYPLNMFPILSNSPHCGSPLLTSLLLSLFPALTPVIG